MWDQSLSCPGVLSITPGYKANKFYLNFKRDHKRNRLKSGNFKESNPDDVGSLNV